MNTLKELKEIGITHELENKELYISVLSDIDTSEDTVAGVDTEMVNDWFKALKELFGEFNIGDKVLLPLDEEGVIVNINNFLWGHRFEVQITKNTFSAIGETIDFKKEQLKHK